MLLVAIWPIPNDAKCLKPWHMGTHPRVLSESFPMITNMAVLDGFQKSLRFCALDESNHSIGRVN